MKKPTPRALQKLAADLNTYFADRRGKCYICPDKIGRKLSQFVIANDQITLSFLAVNADDKDTDYVWGTPDANRQFSYFRSCSLLQAQNKTELALPVPGQSGHNAPALVAEPDQEQPHVPTIQTHATRSVAQLDPSGHLDTITQGLMDAFKKVSSNSTYNAQAQVQCDIAGKVIDAFKVKAQIIATLSPRA